MLDGASRVRDLISLAKDQDMPGIALTDHGVMYGAIKFYKEAIEAGIKPIIGCEVYVAADRHDRSRAPYYHLTLLARTAEGYKNLMKLSTAGYLEGFYRKPRADMEDRKSTRLNSSHANIPYAVFCLKKQTYPPVAAVASVATSDSPSFQLL